MPSIVDQILLEGGYQYQASPEFVRDPATSPNFAAQDSGSGSMSLGGGAGYDWIDWSQIPGMEDLAEDPSNSVSGAGNPRAVLDRLQQLGYRVYEQPGEDSYTTIRGVVGPNGQFIGQPQRMHSSGGNSFFNAALLGLGAFGGAAIAAQGGGGAAAGTAMGETLGGAAAGGGTAGGGTAAGGISAADAAAALGGVPATGGTGSGGTTGASGIEPIADGTSTIPQVPSGPGGSGSTAGGRSWQDILAGLGEGAGSMGMRDWLSVLSGLYGLNLASNARDEMDPFRSQRPYYQQRLMELEQNPSLITQRPGWRAGTEAITREMTSRGYMGSGNQAVALQRFGGDFYGAEMSRLAGLAGAGATPGAGMPLQTGLAGQSLASIGYGLAPYTSARPRTTVGGSYYGGGYTNPADDPAGVNQP